MALNRVQASVLSYFFIDFKTVQTACLQLFAFSVYESFVVRGYFVCIPLLLCTRMLFLCTISGITGEKKTTQQNNFILPNMKSSGGQDSKIVQFVYGYFHRPLTYIQARGVSKENFSFSLKWEKSGKITFQFLRIVSFFQKSQKSPISHVTRPLN